MATHASITLKQKDGKYKSVYLHNDGYPDGAGEKLKNYYNTYDKVDQLLNLGNLSSLGKNPIDDPKLWDMDYYFELARRNSEKINYNCRTYKGRGDTDEDAIITDNLEDIIGNNDYDYLFEDNKWYIVESNGDKVEF